VKPSDSADESSDEPPKRDCWWVLVNNLPKDIPEGELRQVFSSFGQVKDVKLTLAPDSDSSIGLIGFPSRGEVLRAVDSLDLRRVSGWPHRLSAKAVVDPFRPST